MTEQIPPEGFEPHFRKSALTDPWEPLFSKRESDRVRIGLYLREPHCNSRGLVHGGLIATLADNAMVLSCVAVIKGAGRETSGLVTVSLTTDFIGSARLGQWLEVNTHFVKAGGSLAFADSFVTADGAVVARASASFKILSVRK
ncbi:PaaI family thioesterase [Ponticaulis koreensis]|uniref:PaaI family thioesterase n=1 Tax=Ponticaulis koreensis TaxID=1123045 RepID=UPI0003B46EF2|nr:PaaI family thioesterase [Ponticaulis koreensis]